MPCLGLDELAEEVAEEFFVVFGLGEVFAEALGVGVSERIESRIGIEGGGRWGRKGGGSKEGMRVGISAEMEIRDWVSKEGTMTRKTTGKE